MSRGTGSTVGYPRCCGAHCAKSSLDAATQKRMYTPLQLADGRTQEYGFGFRATSHEGHRLVGHGGGIPGFHTFMARFLDDKQS